MITHHQGFFCLDNDFLQDDINDPRKQNLKNDSNWRTSYFFSCGPPNINESKSTTKEKIEKIMFPEVLSSLQQELKYYHQNLSHLYPKYMFRL